MTEAPEREPLRLLIVDDDETDRQAVRRSLHAGGVTAVVREAGSARETLDALAGAAFDCVLLDYYLPDMPGLELFQALKRSAPDLPVVIFTGRGDEDVAVELMKAGAADYLPKSSLGPERLAAGLRHAMELTRATAARRLAEAERERLLRLEQEARARAEQAIVARDYLLAVVAHDLRNPLQLVMTAAWKLAAPLADEERARWVQLVERSSREMNRLIDDLLDFSRMEAGRFRIERERVELADVLREAREAFEPTARERRIALVCELEPGLGAVAADSARLSRLIANLLGNAFQFTPEGGQVSLRVLRRGGEVEIVVQDTGRGVAPADLPHIFERHYQGERASRSGAGLGLTICKGIAEAHGGRIWAESAPGAGSAFHVVLPAEAPAAAA